MVFIESKITLPYSSTLLYTLLYYTLYHILYYTLPYAGKLRTKLSSRSELARRESLTKSELSSTRIFNKYIEYNAEDINDVCMDFIFSWPPQRTTSRECNLLSATALTSTFLAYNLCFKYPRFLTGPFMTQVTSKLKMPPCTNTVH